MFHMTDLCYSRKDYQKIMMECICYAPANANGKSTWSAHIHVLRLESKTRSKCRLHVRTILIHAIEENKLDGNACWNIRPIYSGFSENESRKNVVTNSALRIINFSDYDFAICTGFITKADSLARIQSILQSDFENIDESSKPLVELMCPNNGQYFEKERTICMGRNKIKIKVLSKIIEICRKSPGVPYSSSVFSLHIQCSILSSADLIRRMYDLCACKCLLPSRTRKLTGFSVDYKSMKACLIAKVLELKPMNFYIEITSMFISRCIVFPDLSSFCNTARKVHRAQVIKQLLKISDDEHICKITQKFQSKGTIQSHENESKHVYSSVNQRDIHLWKNAKFKNSIMTETLKFFRNHGSASVYSVETVGERKHKEWLSYDFDKFLEISIFPVFRRNDLEYSFQQILDGTPYLSSEVMRFEHHRLSSFANYTSSDGPSVLLMAKAGWYATGNGKETKTFCCMIINSVWKKEDDPFHVHKELYSDCAFILGTDLGQVSIQQENPDHHQNSFDSNHSNVSEISTNLQKTHIVSSTSISSERLPEGHMGIQSQIDKLPEFSSKLTHNTSTTWSIDCPSRSSSTSRRVDDSLSRSLPTCDIKGRPEGSSLNESNSCYDDNDNRKIESRKIKDNSKHICQEPLLPPLISEKPKHIEYSTVGVRASSFSGFPISSRKTPKEFAVGGFYYRGFGDRTTCFHCGISLQGWSVEDDVFVEHVRYNPLCQYMRQLKGDDFVKLVITATQNPQIIPSSSGKTGDNSTSQDRTANDITKRLKEMGFSQSAISAALGRVATKNVCLTIQSVLDVIVENKDIEQRNAAYIPSTTAANGENRNNLNLQENLENAHLSGSTASGFSTDLSSTSKSELDLADQFICKICMDERVGVVFTPCGHIVTCSECSKSLRKCPICRENIRDKVRTVITD